MNYSALFSNQAIGAQFDAIIARDAAAGRVNHQFRSLLQTAYGVAMPAAPVAFADAVNAYRAMPVMPTFDKGPGSVKGAKSVHEALAALTVAIIDGGRVNNMPALADAPAWLLPKAPKVKAPKAVAPTDGGGDDAGDNAGDDAGSISTNDNGAGAALIAEAGAAMAKVIALLKHGAYDANQRAALYAALEQSNAAPVAADAAAASPKARREVKRAKAESQALADAMAKAVAPAKAKRNAKPKAAPVADTQAQAPAPTTADAEAAIV